MWAIRAGNRSRGGMRTDAHRAQGALLHESHGRSPPCGRSAQETGRAASCEPTRIAHRVRSYTSRMVGAHPVGDPRSEPVARRHANRRASRTGRRVGRSRAAASPTGAMPGASRGCRRSRWWGSRLWRCDPPYAEPLGNRSGNRIRKRVPCPGVLSHSMLPPSTCVTSVYTMCMPRPEPPCPRCVV